MPERVGPYRIEREIGRGGMGVVYLAHDDRLDRVVAIKALPEELATDAGRLERFEREAKTLASLNHPNIGAIYGVEEQQGQKYLVLEYVEGETLADRLDRGPLPPDEAVEVAVEIARGLEAAHEAGVIHRDLKPANIKLTPEGKVKVLDFGLAKADEGFSSTGSGLSQSPTMTSPLPQHSPTIPGAILGTAAYMSPEQARGRRVDKRTDIWSFGIVLYEMLAGASPFYGETATDSIGAVLHKDLELGRLPPRTPTGVLRVLSRCVERDRDLRYRDIGDVRIELLRANDETGETDAVMPGGRGRRWLAAALGAALVLSLSALAYTSTRSVPAPTPRWVSLDPPPETRVVFDGDLAGPPVVSPDGRYVAFAATREGEIRRLWVRDLGEPDAREIPGTDGVMFPFWSPDSREIGFFTPGTMCRLDLASETIQKICSVDQARGGAWTEDGRILYARNFRGGLWIVDARGGAGTPLTEADDELHTTHRWPWVIPGSDRYLFSAVSSRAGQQENNGIYLGSLDSDEPPVRVIRSNYSAAYVNGYLLHVRENVLLAERLDPRSGEAIGKPVVVAKNLAADYSTWHGQFSASPGGVLVFQRKQGGVLESDRAPAFNWRTEGDLVTVMRSDGRLATALARGRPIRFIDMSPDGRLLAMEVSGEDGSVDIWIHPSGYIRDSQIEDTSQIISDSITLPKPTRLTALPSAAERPTWSPDSAEIAFRWAGDETNPRGIYRKRLGEGTQVLVHDNQGEADHPIDWTPDGKFLIVISGSVLPTAENDIWAVPLDGSEKLPLVTDPGHDSQARVSPDGRWLAYTKTEDGRSEVYVIPFAPAWPGGAGGRRWLISDNGGREPRWSPEGDELFYISDAGVLISVAADLTGEDPVFSPPQAKFQTPWDDGRSYDPYPDSANDENRFAFLDSAVQKDVPITAVLNWESLLDADH